MTDRGSDIDEPSDGTEAVARTGTEEPQDASEANDAAIREAAAVAFNRIKATRERIARSAVKQAD